MKTNWPDQKIIQRLSAIDPEIEGARLGSAEAEAARRLLSQILDAPVPSNSAWPTTHRIFQGEFPKRRRLVVGATAVAGVALLVAMVAVPGSPVRANSAAAAVLSRAASTADGQPLGPVPTAGQFLYVQTLQGGTQVANATTPAGVTLPAWAFQYSDSVQQWLTGSGGNEDTSNQSVNFLTSADQVNWAASGQPMPTVASTWGYRQFGGLFPNTTNLSTDPATLEQDIVSQYENGVSDPLLTFQLAGNLLQEGASPALRSALFQMIEQLPGIQDLGTMTDQLGRQGVGLGLTEDGLEGELNIDPTTSAVLEYEEAVAAPVGNGLAVSLNRPTPLPDGTVIVYTTYVSTGITNTNSSTPAGLAQ